MTGSRTSYQTPDILSRSRYLPGVAMVACLRLACLTLLLALLPAPPAMAQGAQKPLRPGSPPEILVLVSSAYGYPSVEQYVSGLVQALREQGVPLLNIHVEYLDLL